MTKVIAAASIASIMDLRVIASSFRHESGSILPRIAIAIEEVNHANCSVVGFTIGCGNRKSPLSYRWSAWTYVDNSSAISGVGNRRIRRTQTARLISIPSEFPCLG
ncbi:MAG TPA: hypothetical protein DCG12_07965 [Planctomycetaceae bacterium]|nr:hypothetical protein [Planctomycetaceae bacterium]